MRKLFSAALFYLTLVGSVAAAVNVPNIYYDDTAPATLVYIYDTNGAKVPFQMNSPGMIGDGGTDNAAAFQAILTNLATNGGSVILPCGDYVIKSSTTATIAAGKRMEIIGSGRDCTILDFQGAAVDGPFLTQTDQYGSSAMRHITFRTDQAGTRTAIHLKLPTGASSPGTSVYNDYEDLSFVGSDAHGAQTKYWSLAFWADDISSVNFNNNLSYGPTASFSGTVYKLNGDSTHSKYSVLHNINNLVVQNCGTCIDVGDWTQGIQINSPNFTGVNHAVLVGAGYTGIGDQLNIVGGQFGFNTDHYIEIDSPYYDVTVTGSRFVLATAAKEGFRGQGVNFSFVGNTCLSTIAVGVCAHIIDSGAPTGHSPGIIEGNSVYGPATGFVLDANVTAMLGPNSYQSVTTPITNNSTAAPTTPKGVIDASVSPTGYIGEVVESYVPFASAVAPTSTVVSNVTSVSIGAGDWDCRGTVDWLPTNTPTLIEASISTISATNSDPAGCLHQATFVAAGQQACAVNSVRLNNSTSKTVYLVQVANFAAGTMKAWGALTCRRMR